MPNPAPVNLDDIERLGATRFGQPVVKLCLVLKDGRKVIMETPAPVASGELTDTERAILNVLKANPKPMKRATVAKALGRFDVTGSFGAAFRQLDGKGLVYRHGAEYTDDPTKFAADA